MDSEKGEGEGKGEMSLLLVFVSILNGVDVVEMEAHTEGRRVAEQLAPSPPPSPSPVNPPFPPGGAPPPAPLFPPPDVSDAVSGTITIVGIVLVSILFVLCYICCCIVCIANGDEERCCGFPLFTDGPFKRWLYPARVEDKQSAEVSVETAASIEGSGEGSISWMPLLQLQNVNN